MLTFKSLITAFAAVLMGSTAIAQEVKTYNKFPKVTEIEAEQIDIDNNEEIQGMYLTENNLILHLVPFSYDHDADYKVYSYPELEKKGEFGKHKDFYFARSNPASTGKNSITVADRDKLKHISFQDSKPTITYATMDTTLSDVLLMKDSVLCRESDLNDDYELRFYQRDGSYKKAGEFPETLSPRFENNYMRYCAYNRIIAGKPNGQQMALFYRYIRRYKIFDHNGDLLSDNILLIQPSMDKPALSEEEQLVHPEAIFTTDKHIYTLNLDNRYDYTPEERTPQNIQVFDWDGNPVEQFILPYEAPIRTFVVDEERGVIYGAFYDEIYRFKL